MPHREWREVWVVMAVNFFFSSTFSVLNATIPDIAADFGESEASVAWVTLLPYLFNAALNPAAGRVADIYGRKRTWLLGCALSILSLPTAARSRTLPQLLAMRGLNGLGGALSSPSGTALMLSAFPEHRQSVIQGYSSIANTLAPSLGMLLGGYVADEYGWRVLFTAPTVPVTVAVLLAIWVLPADPERTVTSHKKPFDVAGTVLLATATTALLVGVGRLGADSTADPKFSLILAGSLLPLLLVVEMHAASPILPPQLFRSTEVSIALCWRFIRNALYMALFIIVPLYLRDGCGMSAGKTTLLMFSRPLSIGIMAPLTGELLQLDRFRDLERSLLLVGALVSICDKFLGILLVWDGGVTIWLLEIMLIIQGGATGVMSVSVRLLVMATVDETERANASGIISMISSVSASFGMALGVALVASGPSEKHELAIHVGEHADPSNMHHSVSAIALHRFRHGMLVVCGIYLSFLFLPTWLYCRHAKKQSLQIRNELGKQACVS